MFGRPRLRDKARHRAKIATATVCVPCISASGLDAEKRKGWDESVLCLALR